MLLPDTITFFQVAMFFLFAVSDKYIILIYSYKEGIRSKINPTIWGRVVKFC
jgi:hypothetical protein